MFSQQFSLEGTLRDETKQPLVAATVLVLSQKDSAHVAVGRTDTLGQFRLKGMSEGVYWFLCSYLGYDPIQLEVRLEGEPRTLFLGDIVMKPDAVLLDGVQITAKATPLIMRNDTMYYHAASFQTRPNAAVLELLKKLPGIEVRPDGTILAQGKTVENVLVDGKRFFDDKDKATHILPADAIETVEVYDEASKKAQFTGVSDGQEERTINLVLKEDRKKGWFGEARGSGGGSQVNDARYDAALNFSRFSPKIQAALLGDLSNTNTVNGGFMQNKSAQASINQTVRVGTFWNSSAGTLWQRQQADRLTQQQIFLPEGAQTSKARQQSNDLSRSANANADFFHEPDTLFVFSANVSANVARSEKEDKNANQTALATGRPLFGSLQSTASRSDNHSFSGSLLYGRRARRLERIFYVSANADAGFEDQNADIFSENTFFDADGAWARTDTVNQITRQKSTSGQQGLSVSYTEPIGKKSLLQVEYNLMHLQNRVELGTFDRKEGLERRNDSLSNTVANRTLQQLLSASTQMEWGKWETTLRLSAQQVGQSTTNSQPSIPGTARTFRTLLPSLSTDRAWGESGSIRADYSTDRTPPDVTQLQAVPDLRDPLNIRIGNPNLKPETAHRLSLGFNKLYKKSEINLYGSFNLNFIQNRIIETITVDNATLVRYFRPQNGRGESQQGMSVSLSMPIKKWKMNVGMGGNCQLSSSTAIINAEQNRQTGQVYGQNLSVEYNPSEKFSISINAIFSQNLLSYSVARTLNQRFFNQNYNTGTYWQLPKRFSLTSDFSMSVNRGRADGFNQTVPLWNLSATKRMLSGDRLEISISVNDLLNQNVRIQRTTHQNYIQDEQVNVLSRYFFVTVLYRILAQ